MALNITVKHKASINAQKKNTTRHQKHPVNTRIKDCIKSEICDLK